MLIILLRHVEDVGAIGHEDVPTFLVFRHILRLAFEESVQFGIVVGLDPASFVHRQCLPFAFGLVLVFKTTVLHLRPSIG